jgi:hypothetical protein
MVRHAPMDIICPRCGQPIHPAVDVVVRDGVLFHSACAPVVEGRTA